MGHRWVASLGPYNFKLHYKLGKLNADVDSLSRIDWKTVEPMQRKTTMDLAWVDRTLILDPEIRGRVAVDSQFISKSLRIRNDIQTNYILPDKEHATLFFTTLWSSKEEQINVNLFPI